MKFLAEEQPAFRLPTSKSVPAASEAATRALRPPPPLSTGWLGDLECDSATPGPATEEKPAQGEGND